MAAALAYALPERTASEETRRPHSAAPSEPICDVQEKQGRREVRTSAWSESGFVYDGVRAGRAVRAGLSRRSAGSRPLPMEEIAFFIKDVNNAGLRRAADPADRNHWTRMVALGCLLLLTAVLCFGPRAWLRHSSYRQAELAEQREQLLRTRQQLLVKHAQLTEVDRVTDMAAAQGFSKPELENYIWQKPVATDDAALARAFFSEGE